MSGFQKAAADKRQQSAQAHPTVRRLIAIHNSLAQEHTRCANASKNADSTSYNMALRHIQSLLAELDEMLSGAKAPNA